MSNAEEARGRGRPAVSSRAHIEEVAMRLFAENGYSATTVPMIAEASGVGRATVFRYWGSKSEIVWSEFDQHILRLTELLEGELSSRDSTLRIIQRSVVANLGRSIENSSVWLQRFALVDESEELRDEEARRWADWAAAVAAFVARRHGYGPAAVVPQTIAGAVQGAFLAVLRSRRSDDDFTAQSVLPDFDRALASVVRPLQDWLNGDPLHEGGL
jgi:AcrR family transcriptional regulator